MSNLFAYVESAITVFIYMIINNNSIWNGNDVLHVSL